MDNFDINQSFDFKTAKPVSQVPALQQLRQAYQNSQKTNERENKVDWLDDDIADWLIHQDNETKRHINEMIRHAMALKMAVV